MTLDYRYRADYYDKRAAAWRTTARILRARALRGEIEAAGAEAAAVAAELAAEDEDRMALAERREGWRMAEAQTSTTVGQTADMIRAIATIIASTGRPEWPYANMFDLLRREGRLFPDVRRPRPDDVPAAPRGGCFKAAGKLATEHPERYTYCEGFAMQMIPTGHAWVIDGEGAVIDPCDGDYGPEYVGLPFRVEYLREQILARKIWASLLDRFADGYPLVTGKEGHAIEHAVERAWQGRLPAIWRPGEP